MSQIRERIIALIYEVCRPEKPDLSRPDEPLLAGDLDSLDFASALMAIEDEFGLTLQDDDMEQLNTLNKLVARVEAAKG